MKPKFSRTKLAHYIASSTQPEAELAREVAAFLIDSGKTAELDSLMRDVSDIRARENGVVELTARSAFPLDTETKAQIERVAKGQYPGSTSVIIHEVRDADAVGGVRIELSNADLDLTIRSKLHKLREAIA